ncbi:MAG: CRISPR-associated CARF protein Csa3 [Methanosarcina sp.]
MKTYISLLGFDTSQFFSLIVKYGIEKNDKIILIKPQDECDERGQRAVREIEDIANKIDKSITVDVYKVNHLDFSSMLLSIIDLLNSTETEIIANISGGSRDIFLAFSIACMTNLDKISKITNYSDIDRELREITLPYIVSSLDVKLITLLQDIVTHEPTIASEIADRLQISESTISRNLNKLKELRAIDVNHQGKIKYISTTTTGKIFLKIRNHLVHAKSVY